MITLISNNLIIFAFFKNFKMRTVTNITVVNLCIAHVVSVLGDLFYFLVELYYKEMYRQLTFCRISIFINQFFTNAVIMAMAAIAVDRYLNLVKNSLRRLRLKDVRLIVDYVWVHALVTSLPWDLFAPMSSDMALGACKRLPYPYAPSLSTRTLSYILRTVCVLMPYLVIVWIFILVALSTRRRRAIHAQDTEIVNPQVPKTERFSVHYYNRSTVSAFLLFSIFLTVTLPFSGTVTWSMITGQERLSPNIELFVFFFFRLQGILLPIVYLCRNRFISELMQSKISCCPPKRKRRKCRNQKFTQFSSPNGGKKNQAFVISKSNSRMIRQANRVMIFYTSATQQMSTKQFTDLGLANEHKCTENTNEPDVISIEELSEEATVDGNFEPCVHLWIYRVNSNSSNTED